MTTVYSSLSIPTSVIRANHFKLAYRWLLLTWRILLSPSLCPRVLDLRVVCSYWATNGQSTDDPRSTVEWGREHLKEGLPNTNFNN